MLKRTWLGVVVASSLLVVTTGCEDECTDSVDCADKGPNFVCVDGTCEERAPQADAGVDSGVPVVDAGVDGGGGQDGGADAGPECTTGNPTCNGPFACDLATADGGAGTCRPLWIGVTESIDAGIGAVNLSRATIVQFSDAAQRTILGAGAATRYPRWSPDGTAVVYVQEPTVAGTGPMLLQRHALAGGTDTTLINSGDAGTNDFIQLEYAPSSNVLWTRVTGPLNTKSGIQWVPGAGGGTLNQTSTGTLADWFPDGNRFAYANTGIKIFPGDTALTSAADDIMPEVSRDGSLVLFIKRNDGMADGGQESQLFQDLYVVPAAGGSPQVVEAHVAPVGTEADGGTAGSYVTNHTWGANNTAVYVRVNYFTLASGTEQRICEPADPICGGKAGQQIVFQPLGGNGAPAGTPVVSTVGVVPSVSPDGAWLAYQIRSAAGGTDLRVVPIDATGTVTGAGHTHTFPQLLGGNEEARPRWQPKP